MEAVEAKVWEGDSLSTLMSVNRLRAKLRCEWRSASRLKLIRGVDRPRRLPRPARCGLIGRRGGLGEVEIGSGVRAGLIGPETCSNTLVGEYQSHSRDPATGLQGTWTARGEGLLWGITEVL